MPLQAPPLAGLLLCVAAVIVWMKLVSYAHCCNDLRAARRQNEVRRGSPNQPALPHQCTIFWTSRAYGLQVWQMWCRSGPGSEAI